MTANDLQSSEVKQRDSLIFNSIQMADALINELFTKAGSTGSGDEPSIHVLSDLLKKST
jgi:HEPN domain-containing protein